MPAVKIFSTTTCPYCKLLKSYLKEKNVSFEDVLLDEAPDQAQASIDSCGSLGVPCTHIKKDDGTEVNILGLDKEKINEALGIS